MASASTPQFVIDRLVDRLYEVMAQAGTGHCLRVEPLARDVAMETSRRLRDRHCPDAMFAVLAAGSSDLEITVDRAIEVRNRKALKLCLFVPTELQDAALSSLSNSFAVFDVVRFLKVLVEDARGAIPPELRDYVQAVRSQLRRTTSPPAEWEIDFYASLIQDPDPTRAGEQLWKVGLIPDLLGDRGDFRARLERNRVAVDRLCRPRRVQMSLEERIASLNAEGSIPALLRDFLRGRTLRTDREWQREILLRQRGTLTFEEWRFADVAHSQLEAVVAEPFTDEKGAVRKWCHLQQAAAGEELQVVCKPKARVTVKWQTRPSTPAGVATWRVEMLPSKDEYDREALGYVDLPSKVVTAGKRSATLACDIEVLDLQVRRVVVAITPLDENGFEIVDPVSNQAFECESQDFWLEPPPDRGEEIEEVDAPRTTRTAQRDLAGALLEAARTSGAESRVAEVRPWERDDLWYLPIVTSDRKVRRIGMSEFMYQLQTRILEDPDGCGRFHAVLDGVQPLAMDVCVRQEPPDFCCVGTEWEEFLRARRQFFKEVRGQAGRGLVEVMNLDERAVKRVQTYVRSYLRLLQEALVRIEEQVGDDATALTRDHILALCSLDTVHITCARTSGAYRAMAVLPTHPLRCQWLIAYAELLRYIEDQLLTLPRRERSKRLWPEVLAALSPTNFPAFLPAPDGIYSFAGNLNFLTGVALPPQTADPGGVLHDVARLSGYPDEYVEQDVTASDISLQIADYLRLHPYVETLSLDFINGGMGSTISEICRKLLTPTEPPEAAPKRLDVVVYNEVPEAQSRLSNLPELLGDIRSERGDGGFSHLHPLIQISERDLSALDRFQEVSSHVTACIDHFRPQIGLVQARSMRDSASAYGLIARLLSDAESTAEGTVWSMSVRYSGLPGGAKHPVSRAYSTDLAEVHDALLRLTSCTHVGGRPDMVPCLRLVLGDREQAFLNLLHRRSEWVVFAERYLRPECYDDPSSSTLASLWRDHVVDCAPEATVTKHHARFAAVRHNHELEDIIRHTLERMRCDPSAEDVRKVLRSLKSLSGRLVLELLSETSQPTDIVAVSLLTDHLRAQGELRESFAVPLSVHPEIVQPASPLAEPRPDLLLVRPGSTWRLTLVQVRYLPAEPDRTEAWALAESLAADARRSGEALVSSYGLEMSDDLPLDAPLRRRHLADSLQFYLDRAHRYGHIPAEKLQRLTARVRSLESEAPPLDLRTRVYLIHSGEGADKPFEARGATTHIIGVGSLATGHDWAPQEPAGDTAAPPADSSAPVDAVEPQEAIPVSVHLPPQPSTAVAESACREDAENAEAACDGRDTTEEDPTFTPESLQHEIPGPVSIVLGTSVGRGVSCVWCPSTQGSPHLAIIGISGQGKTVTTKTIIEGFATNNLTTLVFDFHGELSDDLPGIVPDATTVVDAVDGLPFSPLELDLPRDKAQPEIFALAEIVGWVCELGFQQRDLVYEAMRNCYLSTGNDTPLPGQIFEEIGRLEGTKQTANVRPRVRALFDDDFGLFRPQPDVRFYDLLRGVLVINVRDLLSEEAQRAACAFLLRKIYRDMLRWRPSGALRLALVLDEAHRITRDTTLPRLMREGRKFGVSVVTASQSWADFHKDVLGNTGAQVIFRVNNPESRKVAGLISSTDDKAMAHKIELLTPGMAMVNLPNEPRPIHCAMRRPGP